MNEDFWILDGYGMFFQSFYAVKPLTTSFGQPINAVYGMLTSILKIVNKFKPKYLCVALDTGSATFREEIYNEMNTKMFFNDLYKLFMVKIASQNYSLSQKIENKEFSLNEIREKLNINLEVCEKYSKLLNLDINSLEVIMLSFFNIKIEENEIVKKLYKGNRKETPIELKSQFAIMKEMLDFLQIKYFSFDNHEADDVIAYFANKVVKDYGFNVKIASNDKDLNQLLDDKIQIYNFKKKDFITRDNFFEEYKFEPKYFADFLALTGDSSDNIPGVKGIGKKTANELIINYKTIENILENLVLLNNVKAREMIKDNIDAMIFSKKMTLLKDDLNIDFNLEDFKFSVKENMKNFSQFTKKYEFSSFIKNNI